MQKSPNSESGRHGVHVTLSRKDQELIWHPYTQMATASPAIPIVRGAGALLFDADGKSYIDGVSSWWVTIHGHAHPYIAERIYQQASVLEHCIFAGFTHPPAIELADNLLPILPGNQSRVFYSDDGSTAVEVALKMAIQYWENLGKPRKKILALKNGYHGDTFGAMSLSSRGPFTRAFRDYLFEVEFLDLPSPDTLLALDSNQLDQYAAFIFEPLVQGSGGMIMYDPNPLGEYISRMREHGILIIADEVMTGFGRTGTPFAMDQVSEKPDIICLSKGLTGGTMALGLTSCSSSIFDAFWSQDRGKTLYHGHSFTANPIACTAALASLELFRDPRCQQDIQRICGLQKNFLEEIRGIPWFKNHRCTGTILAFEVSSTGEDSYTHPLRDFLYGYFLERRILLRPLGNTLYIMPPYCIREEELNKIYEGIRDLGRDLNSGIQST